MLALIKLWAWCIWSGYTVMGTFVWLCLVSATVAMVALVEKVVEKVVRYVIAGMPGGESLMDMELMVIMAVMWIGAGVVFIWGHQGD